MILIVEGPDGAGKTTFCKRAESHARSLGVGVSVTHFGPTDTAFNDYLDVINDELTKSRDHLVIADRMHLGEVVYGTTRRALPQYGLVSLNLLNLMVESTPGHVVVLAPPVETLKERLAKKGELFEHRSYDLQSERDRFIFLAQMMVQANPYSATLVTEDISLRDTVEIACNEVDRLISRATGEFNWSA